MAVSSSPCTCFHLRRATRRVSQIYDRELAAVDLSLNEYSILRRTSESPRSLSDLADALGMDRSTLSRNIKPLLDEDWLREARGDDARQRLLVLTDKGRERLQLARPHWKRAQKQIDQAFGVDEVAQLHAQLQALTDSLRPVEEAA